MSKLKKTIQHLQSNMAIYMYLVDCVTLTPQAQTCKLLPLYTWYKEVEKLKPHSRSGYKARHIGISFHKYTPGILELSSDVLNASLIK